jgi:lipopolysaccharide transport system permease protein
VDVPRDSRSLQAIIAGRCLGNLAAVGVMLMFTFVFSQLARFDTGDIPYPIFSYTALLPWSLFATSLSFGVSSLINNMGLVTKTYFPREALPLGVIGAALFDFMIASSIFVVMMIIYRVPITIYFLWIPVLLVIQIFLMLGVMLLGAALTVFYRDVRFVVPLGLQLWLYATPIIYPLEMVERAMPQIRPYYMLNPMAGIVESYRNVILRGQPPITSDLATAAVVSITLFFIAYYVFKKLEVLFNDLI